MRASTKLNKALAVYLRSCWEIYPCRSLSTLAKHSGIQRNRIARVLEKHDPELYLEVCGWNPEPFLVPTALELQELDVEGETPKFRLFVQALQGNPKLAEDGNRQVLADSINVHVRTVHKLAERLSRRLEVMRV
mgnify:CR=1 FL=1